jgi:hypothetical protein
MSMLQCILIVHLVNSPLMCTINVKRRKGLFATCVPFQLRLLKAGFMPSTLYAEYPGISSLLPPSVVEVQCGCLRLPGSKARNVSPHQSSFAVCKISREKMDASLRRLDQEVFWTTLLNDEKAIVGSCVLSCWKPLV